METHSAAERGKGEQWECRGDRGRELNAVQHLCAVERSQSDTEGHRKRRDFAAVQSRGLKLR